MFHINYYQVLNNFIKVILDKIQKLIKGTEKTIVVYARNYENLKLRLGFKVVLMVLLNLIFSLNKVEKHHKY